ncbi:hypothetical protein NSQ77_12325 [Oceanobacillus sp. FSL K6-2867]|uniref:hypothetical protein n=1 Tax=Oceanobacillus sp. FSL K6-2867 TaxID=2954748 RepID=UPI0030DC7EFF
MSKYSEEFKIKLVTKYNSYKGKVEKVAKNRLPRRFSTSIPLQILVTDITEFKCLGEEKLYLKPISRPL